VHSFRFSSNDISASTVQRHRKPPDLDWSPKHKNWLFYSFLTLLLSAGCHISYHAGMIMNGKSEKMWQKAVTNNFKILPQRLLWGNEETEKKY
jgi:hypothetical protein